MLVRNLPKWNCFCLDDFRRRLPVWREQGFDGINQSRGRGQRFHPVISFRKRCIYTGEEHFQHLDSRAVVPYQRKPQAARFKLAGLREYSHIEVILTASGHQAGLIFSRNHQVTSRFQDQLSRCQQAVIKAYAQNRSH
jgi:hypothetical protein